MARRLKQAGYDVVTYPSAMHFLVNLPNESGPSCIILDVRMPDLDGPALQKRLSELGSMLPVIFLSGYLDIPVTVQAIKAGAHDFLTKPVASDELFRAIGNAVTYHRTLRDLKDKLDGVRACLGRLTPREREVFDLLIRGNTNRYVARALGCTERTIKAHRHRVMEKMQAQTFVELVSLAERVGILGGEAENTENSGQHPTTTAGGAAVSIAAHRRPSPVSLLVRRESAGLGRGR